MERRRSEDDEAARGHSGAKKTSQNLWSGLPTPRSPPPHTPLTVHTYLFSL